MATFSTINSTFQKLNSKSSSLILLNSNIVDFLLIVLIKKLKWANRFFIYYIYYYF